MTIRIDDAELTLTAAICGNAECWQSEIEDIGVRLLDLDEDVVRGIVEADADDIVTEACDAAARRLDDLGIDASETNSNFADWNGGKFDGDQWRPYNAKCGLVVVRCEADDRFVPLHELPQVIAFGLADLASEASYAAGHAVREWVARAAKTLEEPTA